MPFVQLQKLPIVLAKMEIKIKIKIKINNNNNNNKANNNNNKNINNCNSKMMRTIYGTNNRSTVVTTSAKRWMSILED